jgi:hypothetical protein
MRLNVLGSMYRANRPAALCEHSPKYLWKLCNGVGTCSRQNTTGDSRGKVDDRISRGLCSPLQLCGLGPCLASGQLRAASTLLELHTR